MEGILPIWKPAGWTSHDVVAKARRILKTKRIGHTGTLDPQVTGVLPLCIGRATRVVEYIQELPKAYEAVLHLGIATDTEDMTGTIQQQLEGIHITEEAVRECLAAFEGEQQQVPPMYSAVKVDGKRLYELAREGKVIDRKPRQVQIYSIELLAYSPDIAYPAIHFAVTCSKGTYIRTLCVDIGKALGVPATMASLKRTMSAGITVDHCLTLEQAEELQNAGQLAAKLIAPDEALAHFERYTVRGDIAVKAIQGQKQPLHILGQVPDRPGLVRLYREDGLFIGLFTADVDNQVLRPAKIFTTPETSSQQGMQV